MGTLRDLTTGEVTENVDSLWCPKCFNWLIVKEGIMVCPDCGSPLERHDR